MLKFVYICDRLIKVILHGGLTEWLRSLIGNQVRCNSKANDLTKAILYNAEIEGRTVETVPMNLLVQLGSVVDFKVDMLELVFRKIGTPYTFDQFSDRLDRAKFWLEQCSPESVNRLRATRNWEVYDTLSETQRAEVARLYAFISAGGYTLDELNSCRTISLRG